MADRPKVQIVRPDDETISVYVGGKEVASGSYDMFGSNGMGAIEDTARAVARALGADVEHTDEPDGQPYRYYVTFLVAVKRDHDRDGVGFDYMPAVRWVDLPRPIEGPEDVEPLCAEVAGKMYPVENVRITNFICVDGPC